MAEFRIKTLACGIDARERKRRWDQVYRLILSWDIHVKIPISRDYKVDEEAKPTGGTADLAEKEANPQSQNGDSTHGQVYHTPK